METVMNVTTINTGKQESFKINNAQNTREN